MAETLTIVLKADGSGLTGTLSASTGEFRKFGAEVDKAGSKAEAAGKKAEDAGRAAKRGGDQVDAAQKKWADFGTNVGTIIGGIVVGLTALLAKQINVADSTGKMAERLGVGTRFISELGYAAKESGANTATLEGALAALNTNATKAADGVKGPLQAFRAIGVTATDSAGKVKSLETLLPQIADRFAKLEDGPRKSAAAMALFGEQGRQLLPLLIQGSAGIDELRESAVELGLSLGDDAAARAAEFNDNLAALKDQSLGFVNHLMDDALPALAKFSGNLVEDGKAASEAGQSYTALGLIINSLATGYYYLQAVVGSVTVHIAAGIDTVIETAKAGTTAVWVLLTGTASALKSLATGDLQGAAAAFQGTVGRMSSITAQFANSAKVSIGTAQEMTRAFFSEANQRTVEQWSDAVDGATKATKQNTTATEEAGKVYATSARQSREKEKADREAAQSTQALNEIIRSQQNDYIGPVAKAWNDYQSVLAKVRKEQEDLIRVGRMTTETEALVVEAKQEANRAYERNLQLAQREQAEIDRRKDVVGSLVQDYMDESRAVAMSAKEHAVQVAILKAEDNARKVFQEGHRDSINLTLQEVAALREGIEAAYTQRQFLEQSAATAGEYRDNWWNAIDGVSGAMGDWLTGGIRGFRSFTDEMLNIGKRWLADMITTFTRAQLGKVFTSWMDGASSGGGSGGGWFSQLAGTLRGGNNLTGTNAMAANNSWMGAASSMQGALSGISGNWMNAGSAGAGSMAGFGNNMGNFAGAGIGAAGAGVMGSMASIIPIIGWIYAGMQLNNDMYAKGWKLNGGDYSWGGAAASPFPDVAVGGAATDKLLQKLGLDAKTSSMITGTATLTALFGRKAPKVQSQGLMGSYGFEDFTGQNFADIKAKGGLFRSDKKWTEYSALDSDLQDTFNVAIRRTRTGVSALAEQLGMDITSQLSAVRVDIGKVKLDADPEKAKAQMEELLANMIETLAGKGVGMVGFDHLLNRGFEASDVMYGLASAIQLMTGNAQDLGRALNTAELELVGRTVEMFQKLATAAGTTLEEEISAITAAASGYGSVVGTAQQEIATMGFSGFAKSLLQVKQEEKERIRTLQAQAKALGGLSAREEDLAKVREASQLKTDALVRGLESELVDLALNRLNDQIEQLGGSASGAGSKIQDFINSLRMSDTLSPDTDAQRRVTANDLMSTAALAGDADAFTQYAQQFLEVSRALNASAAGYQADYDRVLQLAKQFGGDGNAASLEQLYAQREALQAQQEAAARLERAQRIAQGVSDLSGVNGRDPLEILRSVTGMTPDQLAGDLGLSVGELGQYLSAQKTDIGDLADILYELPKRIAAEMITVLVDREVPVASAQPSGGNSGGGNSTGSSKTTVGDNRLVDTLDRIDRTLARRVVLDELAELRGGRR